MHPTMIAFGHEWFGVNGKQLAGNPMVATVFDDNSWGLQWSGNIQDGFGKFPQYFKEENNVSIAIPESWLPEEITLDEVNFQEPSRTSAAYVAELQGAWAEPGPAAGPFTSILVDGSRITYYWYRFIDQPVFQQYNWSEEEKNKLQSLVEQMHQQWTLDKNYMHPLTGGELVSVDQNLIVSPPQGMEAGYVPIVTRQSRYNDVDCSQISHDVLISTEPSTIDENKVMVKLNTADQGITSVKWSNGQSGLITSFAIDEPYSAVMRRLIYHLRSLCLLPDLTTILFLFHGKQFPEQKHIMWMLPVTKHLPTC
jgi:hypothetical protein